MDITSNKKEVGTKWEIIQIKDITINLDNKRKPLNEAERRQIAKKQLYPYIGANNIMGYVDEYIFDQEIICIAEDGGSWGENQKCCVHIQEKCWVNNHAHVLGSNGKADLKYLMYYLNAKDLNKFITGSTRGKLTKSALDSIQIPLPPLPVQNRIAAILDAADALRRKDQELLKKYDELAQAIFIDMFGDPVRNEKGWEVKKLGDAVHFPSGLVDPKTKPYSSFYHVGGDNIERNTGRLFGLKRSNELSLKSGKFHFTKNHILYNKIRPNLNKVALPDFEGICSADMYPLLPNENLILKEYLYFIIRTDSYLDFAEKQARRANIPKINMKEMACFEFPIPPLEIQIKFVELFEVLKVNSVKINQTLIKSDSLFQTLLHKAFKGEL